MTVAEFLGRLERVKRSGTGWVARCPAHEDRHASLSIGKGTDGRILINCFAGCTMEAIVAAVHLEPSDLFEGEGGSSTPSDSRQVRQVVQAAPRLVAVDGERVDQTPGLTIEALAEAKKLPLELLTGLGVETVRYFGPEAVQIPYTDETGEIVGARYRLSLAGDPKFKWKKGTKAKTLLYGASRLREARDAGYVVLVEGETDAWTLMYHGFHVVALPGAAMWEDENHAERLEGIGTIYVVVEPDKGGETLLGDLRESVLRPRVRVLTLPAKDASALHLTDEEGFGAKLLESMASATTLLDVEQEVRSEQAAAEWETCQELAHERSILFRFEKELRARGFVGSIDTPKLIFLVLVSRLLPRPVSLVLRGLSSTGKSYNVETTLPFFPRSSYFDRSGMSERALVYSDESFKNRIIYIAEADAIAGEGQSAYFLRTLISENRLVYETVEKDGDRLVTRVIVKPGPTGVILTTTRLRLNPENETRMLALTVPDDPALTRSIMRAIALRDDDAVDVAPPAAWTALQSWLELGGERRVIDEDGFLLHVAELVRVVAVRLRRDFALVRSLVFAHAILHQASRERDEHGRVIATLFDYLAVRKLIGDIVSEGIGATVSDDIRETVAAVANALEFVGEETVKRVAVQEHLGLDDRATNRRLGQACEAGYLENANPGRGKIGLYKLGNPVPDDIDVLPTVAELREHLDNLENPATAQGDIRAPSPSGDEDARFWLAADGAWRSRETELPNWPGEVKDTALEILDCDTHPGGHKVTHRAAGFVYLACGCRHLKKEHDAGPDRQEGARS